MTPTPAPGAAREDFTPPLPHDPPPPPGYVDPLAEAEALADLTTLVVSGTEAAEGERSPTP